MATLPCERPAAAAFARLLPDFVASAEARASSVEAELFPEEERFLARASARRRREFASGRACARAALGSLGHAPCAIAVGARGEPLWPRGFLGSITHRAGRYAAAVARSSDVAALGIDAEPNAPLAPRVLARLANEAEREMLAQEALRGEEPEICLDRLLFSAKEAAYKAWFALRGEPVALEDIEVAIDVRGRELRACPHSGARLGGHAPDALSGRWSEHEGLLYVAFVLASPRR